MWPDSMGILNIFMRTPELYNCSQLLILIALSVLNRSVCMQRTFITCITKTLLSLSLTEDMVWSEMTIDTVLSILSSMITIMYGVCKVIVFQDGLFYFSEVSVFSCSLSPLSVVNDLWMSSKFSNGRNLTSLNDGLSLGSGTKPEWRSSSVIHDSSCFLKMPFDRPNLTCASLLRLTFAS